MGYTKQNFIDGQVLKAEHLNNMENELAREKSWNELTDKPFGDVYGDTVVYDNEPTKHIYVETTGIAFVKMSDATPSLADLANGATITAGSDVLTIPAEEISQDGNAIAISMNAVVALTDGASFGGAITFPKKGFYMMDAGMVYSITIPGYSGFATTKTIDAKYLPGSVVLYFDSENYLYKTLDTSDISTRLTATELKSIFYIGAPLYVTAQGMAFSSVYHALLSNDYCILYYMAADGTKRAAYTAEYTAE